MPHYNAYVVGLFYTIVEINGSVLRAPSDLYGISQRLLNQGLFSPHHRMLEGNNFLPVGAGSAYAYPKRCKNFKKVGLHV